MERSYIDGGIWYALCAVNDLAKQKFISTKYQVLSTKKSNKQELI